MSHLSITFHAQIKSLSSLIGTTQAARPLITCQPDPRNQEQVCASSILPYARRSEIISHITHITYIPRTNRIITHINHKHRQYMRITQALQIVRERTVECGIAVGMEVGCHYLDIDCLVEAIHLVEKFQKNPLHLSVCPGLRVKPT